MGNSEGTNREHGTRLMVNSPYASYYGKVWLDAPSAGAGGVGGGPGALFSCAERRASERTPPLVYADETQLGGEGPSAKRNISLAQS